jgi:hypothetical protein
MIRSETTSVTVEGAAEALEIGPSAHADTDRSLIDLGVGTDNLLHSEGRVRCTVSLEAENLTNQVALYNNFLSTFSAMISSLRELWSPKSASFSRNRFLKIISRFRAAACVVNLQRSAPSYGVRFAVDNSFSWRISLVISGLRMHGAHGNIAASSFSQESLCHVSYMRRCWEPR